MVEIPLDRPADTLEMCKLELRILCKGLVAISHTVRLDIGLSDNVKTIFVTKRIPERIVRIMACTDCVHVELLHDEDILDHVSLAYDISLVRIHLVPVHTLDEYRLAVDKKLASDNLHIPESDLDGCSFCLSLLVI